jgi:hypothetical protein
LLAPTRAARQCVEAWRLLHGWRLDRAAFAAANDDSRAFLEWAVAYERATAERNQTDAARLPDLVARRLDRPAATRPRTLAIAGFDAITPQAADFLAAMRAAKVEVAALEIEAIASQPRRVELIEERPRARRRGALGARAARSPSGARASASSCRASSRSARACIASSPT